MKMRLAGIRFTLPALLIASLSAFSYSSLAVQPLETEEIRSTPTIPQPVDLTIPTDDIWLRVRNGFSMPNLNDELVLKHQQYYQSRPQYLRRMVERSSPYLHHIVEELERRGMPTELALLPMVESAYNPMAYSSAHASGLWQFIPSTGKHFNLQQNWWQDQRRDIVASTSAALDYLQYVYELHGDWHLALASYNWGEGAVGRAVSKNEAKGLPTDYSSLTMPNETRNYIPKLQALKNIFSNPRLVADLDLPAIPNETYFRTVVTPAPMDMRLAAEFSGMRIEEFAALNPAYNRPVIPADTALVIPADSVATFKERLATYEAPLANWQPYVVQSGEKIEGIAAKFNLSAAELKNINGIKLRNNISTGQTLLVPNTANGELTPEAMSLLATLPPVVTPASNTAKSHIVKKGETLKGIARQYGLNLADLRKANKLKSNNLKAGTRLALPSSTPKNVQTAQKVSPRTQQKSAKAQTTTERKGKSNKVTHTVKKGDTLFAIAKRYKVDEKDIRRWNKLAGSHLKIGSTITIQLDS